MRVASILLMATLLSACAIGPRSIRTEVTSFNEWSSLPTDRTYTFSRTLQYRSSLEVKSYEDIVRDALAPLGFRLVGDPSQASLVVTLRPSVSNTSVVTSNGWSGYDPFWGGWYGGSYGRGFYGSGWYGSGYGYGPYGGFGNFGNERVDVFHKTLELDIDSQATAGKRFYEGKVETTSYNASLPQVMPVLVHALFSDFPGNNGQSRRVDVPIQKAP